MKKFLMLIISISILHSMSYSQSFELIGIVIDEFKKPLAGASVFLSPVQFGTISDKDGHFHFVDLTAGDYQLQISFVGYHTFVDTLSLNEDMRFDVQLEVGANNLQEIVVTYDYAEVRSKEESLNIEVVNTEYLKQYLGNSLMNTIERLPGVNSIDIGSGQSKPIIRGLGFNRVVVVENNIKHEAQQWGADHGLEIDQFAVENIEVIKGPSSLMYGSDAIGGVIDIKKRQLPAANTIGGTVDLTGKTNNDFIGTSVSVFGRKKWFFADFRATVLGYGDFKVPADSVDIYSFRAPLHEQRLRNTAGNELDLHGSFGLLLDRLKSKYYVSSVKSKNGFFANAHGLEPRSIDTELYDKSSRDILFPYQSVNHLKLSNTTDYQWGRWHLESNLGYQHNLRQEWSQYVSHGYMPAVFPDSMPFNGDLERQFDKDVYSGNVKLHFFPTPKTNLYVGANSEYQDNRIDGRGFIIPAYKQLNIGGFALVKYQFSEKALGQVGVRYDFGHLKTDDYMDWFPSPVEVGGETTLEYLERAASIDRVFNNLSWSAGFNYNPDKWSYKFNIGKSFRMPIAKELGANGVNYHQFSYEVGDADLSPEISYQFDVGIEYAIERFAIGATPFVNYFTNYIFLNPSSEHDRLYGNGNQIYYYTESEVIRYGTELHSHYDVSKALQVCVIGEYVYSEQLSGEKKGFTLPFSPPASLLFSAKFHKDRIKFVDDAYFSIDYKLTGPQNNIVPPEETTPGYQLVNLGLGGKINIGAQKLVMSLQVQNLLNTKYFKHTSYYRLINIPGPGRNIILNLSIPFTGNL